MYFTALNELETKLEQAKFVEPEPVKPIKRVNSNLMMTKISKFMQMKTEAHSSITNSQMSLGDTNSDIREHLINNPSKPDEKLPFITKLERKDSSTSLERKESIMTRFNST